VSSGFAEFAARFATSRFLLLPGIDESTAARAKMAAFRGCLLALICVELWDRAMRFRGDPTQLHHVALAGVATFAAIFVWRPGRARRSTGLCALVVFIDFAWQFPGSANHQYLQLVCLVLLLLLRDEVDEEVRLLPVLLRWLVVVGLFYAGMQKLAWGYYFDGELLAFTIPENPRFAAVLGLAMPGAELERLSRIVIQEGAGPFRVDSLLFQLVSNVAYVAEIALPGLLLWPRTRRLAVIATVAYFGAIESAAREVFFGGLMVALVLLYGPASWLRRSLPVFFVGLAILLVTSFGLLPFWFFS
jgi:hypothetical protein